MFYYYLVHKYILSLVLSIINNDVYCGYYLRLAILLLR